MEGGLRAFDIDAAVGLLSRSAAPLLKVTFFVGAGGWGSAFRARARDAAVGANRPDGVFGRIVELDGVFGRETVDGVFGIGGTFLGVTLACRIVVVEIVDWPVC
jgi:hypothetical protein